MEDSLKRTINIPIMSVDNRISYVYGEGLPKIKDGAAGQLIMLEDDILDKKFIDIVQKEKMIQIFDIGTKLLIAVNRNYIERQKLSDTINIKKVYPTAPYSFIKIQLTSPLFLVLRGTKIPNLYGGECKIPILNYECKSINSAYTKISETYETKRTSHTANVFAKCFYYDEDKDTWMYLECIREKNKFNFISELQVKNNDDMRNCRIALGLSQEERTVMKLVETLEGITIEKIRDILNYEIEQVVSVINSLTEKGVLLNLDR